MQIRWFTIFSITNWWTSRIKDSRFGEFRCLRSDHWYGSGWLRRTLTSQRYWQVLEIDRNMIAYWEVSRLRSYLGYPPVRDALPNTTHFALAALQYKSIVTQLITQNVDGLHHKAVAKIWHKAIMQNRILELHGTLFVCKYSRLALLLIFIDTFP